MNEWGRFALVGLFALIIGWITVRAGLNDIKSNKADGVSYGSISIGSVILLIAAIFIIMTVIVYCESPSALIPTAQEYPEPIDVEYAGDDEYETLLETSVEQTRSSSRSGEIKRRK